MRVPPVLGLLHPSRTGTALATAMRANVALVLWAEEGRSLQTTKRAEWADFVAVNSVGDLVRRSDVILLSCPPQAVPDVAGHIAGAGGATLYLDASGAPIGTLQALLDPARVVTLTVSSPPPWEPGTAWVTLDGAAAGAALGLFAGGPLRARMAS
jgi:hypothetical protein